MAHLEAVTALLYAGGTSRSCPMDKTCTATGVARLLYGRRNHLKYSFVINLDYHHNVGVVSIM